MNLTPSQQLTLEPALTILACDLDNTAKLSYSIVEIGQVMKRKGINPDAIMTALRTGMNQLNEEFYLRKPHGNSDNE